MTFDDSDGSPVAREGVELLDAETLPHGPDNRAGLDDSHEPPVATEVAVNDDGHEQDRAHDPALVTLYLNDVEVERDQGGVVSAVRSEEHTSELQSQSNLVCRLLLEK